MTRMVCLAVLTLLVGAGCVSERERAEAQLKSTGYSLDEVSFLRALQTCDVPATKLFLACGMERLDGEPILITAIQHNERRVVGVMIEAGADVNIKGGKGLTPLMMAAGNGRGEYTELLLLKKADLHARDSAGNTALYWAATSRDTAPARLLLEHGADVSARNNEGKTPLDMASNQAMRDALTSSTPDSTPVNEER